MSSSSRRIWIGWVVAGVVALAMTSSACGAMRASAARQKYIESQTQQHVYKMPITDVWPNVRTMLFEEGYQTKSSDTGGSYSLETEPKADGNNQVRYLVQGVVIDDASCRIEFTRLSQGASGNDSKRDLRMEWLLLQRVDAVSASEIEAAADAEGEKAN